MYRQTEKGCIDLIRMAIEALPTPDYKMGLDYIQKELIKKIPLWAQCKREHSMILLQIRTTNAVESWHRVFKHSFSKGELHKTSLTGCAKHVMVTARDYNIRACTAELNFQTKRHPLVIKHPWMEDLPYPI